MIVFGLLGAAALWLLYGWLLAAIVSSYLSDRKGYGEKPGLASGLFLYPLGVILWLVWPAREDSKWKQLGPFGRGKDQLERPSDTKPDP
jgi:O-antigen ligase